MKWLKGLAITIVALFIIIPTIALLMVGTTTGSKWTLRIALDYALETTSTRVTYDSFDGRLLDTINLRGVSFTTDAIRVDVDTLDISWQPFALFDQELFIDKLALGEIRIVPGTASASEPAGPIQLPELILPVSVQVDKLAIDSVLYAPAAADASQLLVSQLNANLSWRDGDLSVRQLNVERGESFFRGAVDTTTANTYPLRIQADYKWRFKQDISAIDAITADAIQGNLKVQGTLAGKPLELSSEFSTDTTPTQRINATVSNPLTNVEWSANLKLNELPLKLFRSLIEDGASQVSGFITTDTQLSGEASITNAFIEASQLQVTGIGPSKGDLILIGTWQHNGFSPDYTTSDFNFSAQYRQLSLQPITEMLAPNVLTIKAGRIELKGTPTDYEFSAENELTYQIETEDNKPTEVMSSITTLGSGSLEHISISKLGVDSETINLTATAEFKWQPELVVRVDIAEGVARVPNNDQLNLVQLKGGLMLTKDVVRADQLVLEFGESKMELNGTTSEDNKVTGKLTLAELQDIPGLPEGIQELQRLNFEFELAANEQLDSFELMVKELSIDTETLESWSSPDTTSFQISQTGSTWLVQSDPLCLSHNEGRLGSLCSQLSSDNENFFVELSGERLSLRLLNRLRDQDVAQRVAGYIELAATAQMARENLKLVDFSTSLESNNTVFYALDEEMSTRLENWRIEANGDAKQITANLSGTLTEDQGGLIGDFSLSDLYDTQQIKGSLLFQLDDLSMLDWVIPGLRYEGGKATASLALNGTLSQPQFEGDMEVYAETVGFAQTNLVFKDVRLALIDNPETNGELEILGQAKSGDSGWIMLEGLAMPLEQEAYLAIEGQNFRALQLPTATVDISPNLRLYFKDQLIDIAGTVDVPFAQITAPEFDNAVNRSPDVVITRDGEKLSTASSNLGDIQVQAAVRVNLGDNVNVNAYGFEGKLAGSLELVEQTRRPLTAVGSINVTEGIYTIYGQELPIDRGAFIYNGGVVSNPGLNLRVKRTITNGATVRNVSVGAQVGGTLVEPDFRLFSTPAMPDSEVLSYLLVGRSMQSASSPGSSDLQLRALLMLGAKGTEVLGKSLQDTFGFDEFGLDSDASTREASFYVGKYLSPKLYVKYGIGLLDSTNTFMVRYQLTERLLIETMTSSDSQGGDIFYTLEK